MKKVLTEQEKTQENPPQTKIEEQKKVNENKNTIKETTKIKTEENSLKPNFVLVEEEILEENNTNKTNKTNIKSLIFWISLICGFIVIVQLVLNYFSIQFETKIIIEIVSFILAFLVSMGVLGSSLKNKNITDIKEDIQKNISSQINNLSNKNDKSNKTK
ncbi:MAG: hypothetical protein IJW32_00690 [Clostridia bacterium]|nr:hypothetical protein [Clostridia bacterium]